MEVQEEKTNISLFKDSSQNARPIPNTQPKPNLRKPKHNTHPDHATLSASRISAVSREV